MIKRIVALILLGAGFARADGPLFRSSNTYTQQEFDNVYQDLRAVKYLTSNPTSITATTATISALTVSTLTVVQATSFTNSQAAKPSVTLTKTNSGTANEAGPTITLSDIGPAATTRNGNTTGGSIYFNFSQPTSGAEQNGVGLFAQADGNQTGILTPAKFIVQTSQGSGLTTALTIASDQKSTFAGQVVISSHVSTTGNLTFSTSGNGLVGTTTNDSASSGNVGERVESVVTVVSAPANNTIGDATSISLTAGDWDVCANAEWNSAGATMIASTVEWMGISTTSGNSATGIVDGDNDARYWLASTASVIAGLSVPPKRFSVSATTPVYLKFLTRYTAGTPVFNGRITARRVR